MIAMKADMNIDFIDLKSQRKRLEQPINARIQTVLEHGRYVLGPEVQAFEQKLARFGDAQYAIGCANGTDALLLCLMAWGIGPGDAVFCPSFTFCATAEVIALAGATPVFVDIDRASYNMDADHLERSITQIEQQGDYRPRAVIAVDLFGQCADYPRIAPIVQAHGLKLIADSAQGFGATLHARQPLHWADVTTTSFFPAKPLGCYGDGGAILTDDAALAQVLNSLKVHGQGIDKYDNIRVGLNSRLDTIQAAILLEKLAIFPDEIQQRNNIAARYIEALKDHALQVPHILDGGRSTWAQFTIEVPDCEAFAAKLAEAGVPTARYYPRPIHLQSAYHDYPVGGNGLPQTMDCIDKVISLPMSAYLDEATQGYIIDTALAAL